MVVEPADDALEAFDAAVGAAAPAQVVALFGEPDHLDLRLADTAELNEELLGLLDWTAQVLLAVDQQKRRAHLFGVRQRRSLAVQRFALVNGAAQNVVAEERADVRGAVERHEVVAATLRDRGTEALGVADQPGGHEATV